MPAKTPPPSGKKFVTFYDYHDDKGNLAFQIQRADVIENGKPTKMMSVRHREGRGPWIWQKPKVIYPYRLPEVLGAPPSTMIYIVEGEKCADALRSRGAIATTNPFGQGPGKWLTEWCGFFRGKNICLLPDLDDVGKEHMRRIWDTLKPVANSIAYIELPGLKEKQDVFDYFEGGKTIEDLRRYISDAVSGMIEAKVTPYDQGDAYEPPEDRRPLAPRRKTVGVFLSDVKLEPINWLWKGRIPLGAITMLDGDPGFGKSNVAAYVMACVSAGMPFTDTYQGPDGGVVLIDAENTAGTTILPRVLNNGGDPRRIKYIKSVPTAKEDVERIMRFPGDLDLLADVVEEVGAKLVVIDTVMNHLGDELQSRSDQDVRSALTPLSMLASKMGFAVLILRHLNKSSTGPALYRGSGSIGFIGVARVGLVVGPDPEDKDMRILAVSKINDYRRMPSLKFQIVGKADETSFVAWHGETTHDADAILASPVNEAEVTILEEGSDVLKALLSNGGMQTEDIKRHAKEAGISESSLRRAKSILGVVAYRDGGFGKDGRWFWCLKEHVGSELQKPKMPTPESMDTLEPTPLLDG